MYDISQAVFLIIDMKLQDVMTSDCIILDVGAKKQAVTQCE